MSSVSDLSQLVVFSLDDESYGIDILKVQEIVSYIKPYPIPNSPEYFRGVVNLRGTIIPIIDLRIRFNFDNKDEVETSIIVVVSIDNKKYGLLVDAVSDVVIIDHGNVQDKLDVHTGINGQYILGVAKNNDQMIILIDIETLFKDREEIDKITSIAENLQ